MKATKTANSGTTLDLTYGETDDLIAALAAAQFSLENRYMLIAAKTVTDVFQALRAAHKKGQSQDSVSDQMLRLAHMADQEGLYDAADYIRTKFK
jgi:hypothetical protein